MREDAAERYKECREEAASGAFGGRDQRRASSDASEECAYRDCVRRRDQ